MAHDRRRLLETAVLVALIVAVPGLGSLAGCARPPEPAADWPQFRGPGGLGLSAATGLPERWSADSENVRWRTEIPGSGNSSPIAAAGRVFVTTAIQEGEHVERSVLALDAASGELLWQTAVADEALEATHRLNSYAAPTPVTDGRVTFAFFGATLAAVDREGEILWRETVDPDYRELSHYGAASSLVLTANAVVAARDREDAKHGLGWLGAFDRSTGEELWRRTWDDTCCSYATPLVIDRGAGEEVLFTHAGRLTSYDAKSGATFWSQPLTHNQPVTSPTLNGDLLAVFTGADRLRNGAMLLLTGAGAATEVEVLWQTKRMIPQVASPILYGGSLYTVTDNGALVCYDPLTGAKRWQHRLKGSGFRPSLLAGEGKIYVLDSYGRASVVAAGPKFSLIAENDLEEPGNASPAYGSGCLLIRTDEALFCIERHASDP